MNCYNHNEEISVAQCQDCRKGLCRNCSKKFSLPICTVCNSIRIQNEKSQIIKDLLFAYGFGLLIMFMISKFSIHKQPQNVGFSFYLAMFYGYSGIIPGWKILDKGFPKMYFNLSIFYFGYLLIKLFAAIFIGFFALPFITFKHIRRLIQLNKIK